MRATKGGMDAGVGEVVGVVFQDAVVGVDEVDGVVGVGGVGVDGEGVGMVGVDEEVDIIVCNKSL